MEALSKGVEQPKRDSDHSPPSNESYLHSAMLLRHRNNCIRLYKSFVFNVRTTDS